MANAVATSTPAARWRMRWPRLRPPHAGECRRDAFYWVPPTVSNAQTTMANVVGAQFIARPPLSRMSRFGTQTPAFDGVPAAIPSVHAPAPLPPPTVSGRDKSRGYRAVATSTPAARWRMRWPRLRLRHGGECGGYRCARQIMANVVGAQFIARPPLSRMSRFGTQTPAFDGVPAAIPSVHAPAPLPPPSVFGRDKSRGYRAVATPTPAAHWRIRRPLLRAPHDGECRRGAIDCAPASVADVQAGVRTHPFGTVPASDAWQSHLVTQQNPRRHQRRPGAINRAATGRWPRLRPPHIGEFGGHCCGRRTMANVVGAQFIARPPLSRMSRPGTRTPAFDDVPAAIPSVHAPAPLPTPTVFRRDKSRGYTAMATPTPAAHWRIRRPLLRASHGGECRRGAIHCAPTSVSYAQATVANVVGAQFIARPPLSRMSRPGTRTHPFGTVPASDAWQSHLVTQRNPRRHQRWPGAINRAATRRWPRLRPPQDGECGGHVYACDTIANATAKATPATRWGMS
jgi:hypothetical protein